MTRIIDGVEIPYGNGNGYYDNKSDDHPDIKRYIKNNKRAIKEKENADRRQTWSLNNAKSTIGLVAIFKGASRAGIREVINVDTKREIYICRICRPCKPERIVGLTSYETFAINGQNFIRENQMTEHMFDKIEKLVTPDGIVKI